MATQAQPGHPATVGPGQGGFLSVVVAEWIKIRSVRSTFWSLLATVALMVGLALMVAAGVVATWNEVPEQARGNFDPTALSLAGLSFAQLAIAVLGVLVISGEYRTAMIRTTLTAVPQRLQVLAAKAVVFTVVAFVVGTVSAFGSFFLGQALLTTRDAAASITDPGVFRAVVGAGLYLAASGLLGLGVGTLLRHAAAAITVVVAALWLVSPLLNLLPGEWGATVSRYFLANAGQQITATRAVPDTLGPWAGFGVYCAYVAAALIAGAVLLRTRDA